MTQSLIKRDESQLRLFEEARERGEVAELTSARGSYTAERLMRQRPEVYRAVMLLLAQDCGPRSIMRQIRRHFGEGIDSRTIAMVGSAEREFIPTVKERLGERNLLIAHGLQELMMEALDDEGDALKPKSLSQAQSLAVTTGIFQQRGAELIDGGLVIKHEHEHRKFVEVGEMYGALPDDRLPVMDAEIIGLGAGERISKKALAAGREGPSTLTETELETAIDPAAGGAETARSS